MATQISAEKEKEELLQTFKALDADGNGILTPEELRAGVKQLNGIVSNEQEIDKLILMVDTNGSGNIDFSGNSSINTSRVCGGCNQPRKTIVEEENRANIQDV